MLKINPNDSRTYYYLAESLFALKNYEQAYGYYKTFMKLPNNMQDRQIQTMRGRAQARVRQLAPQYE